MALANGTYAECTVAKADVLAPIPDALRFEEAAVLRWSVLRVRSLSGVLGSPERGKRS
jgi:NADPH:quinone reductase-like Zn-dependent oxidoreductase